MKKKTYFYIILILFILILALNYIYTSYFLYSHKYHEIKVHDENYLLFDTIEFDKLKLKGALGNGSENIFYYNYNSNLELILWKINGYKNVNLKNINVFIVDNLQNFQINPQVSLDSKQFEIASKLDPLIANTLEFYSSSDFKSIYHFSNDDIAFLNFVSKGFVIAQGNFDLHIKFKSIETVYSNLAFIKTNDSFFMVLLASNDEAKIKDNLLLEILCYDADSVYVPNIGNIPNINMK